MKNNIQYDCKYNGRPQQFFGVNVRPQYYKQHHRMLYMRKFWILRQRSLDGLLNVRKWKNENSVKNAEFDDVLNAVGTHTV